jgi:hypothetical protein
VNIGLYVWTFLAMLAHAPIELRPEFDGHIETEQEALARYGDIARTITEVCSEQKQPRVCASLLVAIGAGESHFAADADRGPCYREGGHRTRCDSGLAAIVWQTHAHGFDRGGAPITVERLFAERHLAAFVAFKAAAGSLNMCRHLPDPVDRLSGLSGRCQAGLKSARERYTLWRKVSSWRPSR